MRQFGALLVGNPPPTDIKSMCNIRHALLALALAGAIGLLVGVLPARSQTVYRGPNGAMLGTSTQVGDRTIYRDRNGAQVGSSGSLGGTTVYRGRDGRLLGAANQFGR